MSGGPSHWKALVEKVEMGVAVVLVVKTGLLQY
jgi:hypothetical protein